MIADRLRIHAERHPAVVRRALGLLARDFDAPDGLGPRRAAAFSVADDAELDGAAADAHGYVADLLRAGANVGPDISGV